MPTYEYQCTACENRYETREGFDAPSRQPCPKCGGQAKRILFAPPIVFKGSGFYVTDSRKGSSTTVGDYNMGSTVIRHEERQRLVVRQLVDVVERLELFVLVNSGREHAATSSSVPRHQHTPGSPGRFSYDVAFALTCRHHANRPAARLPRQRQRR